MPISMPLLINPGLKLGTTFPSTDSVFFFGSREWSSIMSSVHWLSFLYVSLSYFLNSCSSCIKSPASLLVVSYLVSPDFKAMLLWDFRYFMCLALWATDLGLSYDWYLLFLCLAQRLVPGSLFLTVTWTSLYYSYILNFKSSSASPRPCFTEHLFCVSWLPPLSLPLDPLDRLRVFVFVFSPL